MTGTTHGRMRRGSRWTLLVWGGAAGLLALPAIAMRFTAEVNWTAGDFLAMGAMLLVAAGLVELAVRLSGDIAYRLGACVAVAASFLLIWINLAVGIVGSEDNRANQLFAGVLATALLGAVLAGFRPAGMARAMVAAAVAQGLVCLTVFAMGQGLILAATGVFAGLWLAAAALFARAARKDAA
ncbi:hypothetical protein [Caulobacter endophyticus]|uniref:Uncharacterized protein n=1 Tax=Caulobacter endophyticus TaxID=2172652 RepID=A0A2T9JJD3_9CAUL|nr:hypothetical protein [Caulobacter endophyticus]PVM83815.1 hypothetical protein DDF67_20160 [Caulobacter endophyticus]